MANTEVHPQRPAIQPKPIPLKTVERYPAIPNTPFADAAARGVACWVDATPSSACGPYRKKPIAYGTRGLSTTRQ